MNAIEPGLYKFNKPTPLLILYHGKGWILGFKKRFPFFILIDLGNVDVKSEVEK